MAAALCSSLPRSAGDWLRGVPKSILGFGLFLAFIATVDAAPPAPQNDIDFGVIESGAALAELPLDEEKPAGMIVDQTMTQTGHLFVHGFLGAWRDFPKSGEYNVAIYERPDPRWGSLIWVEQNFVRVFQTFIFPGRADPEDAGEKAARFVYQRIANLEIEKQLFTDPDIAKDEL